MAALEVMITLHPRVVVKVAEVTWKGLNNDLVVLCSWEDARTLHSKLYCAIYQSMKTG